MTPSATPNTARWPALVVAAWVIAAAAGLAGLARYASTPGPHAEPPATWPADTAIPREAGRTTLVLFLHPRCPCSTATIRELQRALVSTSEPTSLCVVVSASDPADFAAARERVVDLRPAAIIDDPASVESLRFGAATSGEVLVYDAAGRLAFHGGITPSRGHEGDNAGRTSIAALLSGTTPTARETDVFGCPLCTPPASTRASAEVSK